MIGVKTIQLKLPLKNDSFDEVVAFYKAFKEAKEYGGCYVRMRVEDKLMIIEYDTTFDTDIILGELEVCDE